MTARLIALIALAACGDNRAPADDAVFTAVSGGRLSLQKYRYDDGTEQSVAGEFYDLQLHTRCSPQLAPDGAPRCVPVADDAVYSDAGCTALVGIARTIARPTHFLVHDTAAGRVLARVVRAGAQTAPITQFWETAGGACVGPTPVAPGPGTPAFFATGNEVDPTSLVELHASELGDGRLALEVRSSDDGMQVLAGLRDRELDTACSPAVQGDGSIACQPLVAPAANLFADPACGEPVVAASAPPQLAAVIDAAGCTHYYRVGREMAPPLYRRDGDACAPVDDPVSGRLFALDAPVALPPLGRSLAPSAGRRLAHVVLDPGFSSGLRFLDDRLHDPDTGADCRPRTLRNVIRCIPVNAAAAAPLFLAGCTAPAAVAELPHSCEPLGFATVNRPFQIRAIGEPAPGPVFRIDGAGACQPVTGSTNSELRTLGPSIDLTAFVEAIYYGERAP